jgi:hypothetical protein
VLAPPRVCIAVAIRNGFGWSTGEDAGGDKKPVARAGVPARLSEVRSVARPFRAGPCWEATDRGKAQFFCAPAAAQARKSTTAGDDCGLASVGMVPPNHLRMDAPVVASGGLVVPSMYPERCSWS